MSTNAEPIIGMRVGVFHSMNEKTIALLGYGVYEGDEIPPEDILAPEIGPPALLALAMPKLRLDDGTVVWGCEAWWHAEDAVKVLAMPPRQIVKPKLESIRAHAQAAWKKANEALDDQEEALP